MSRPVVVADAGPLIALAACDCLNVLRQVFGAVHIPQAVLTETAMGERPGAARIAAFASSFAQIHLDRNDDLYRRVIQNLDAGEAQALSLAHALNCAVLMDERRGRATAKRQGLKLFGVLGVLLQAKRMGALEKVGPVLSQMQGNGYRFSQELVNATLELAGEAIAPENH